MHNTQDIITWKEIITAAVNYTKSINVQGRVEKVDGLLIYVKHLTPVVGSQCQVGENIFAEVVSVNSMGCTLLAYVDTKKININDVVVPLNGAKIFVGDSMLGRVINGMGQPIDDKGSLRLDDMQALYGNSVSLLDRPLIEQQLITGIRAVDAFTPIGKGQRMGIFSGSGVGKSTLLGMIARHVKADVNIVALIGERGREVKEFLEYELGEEGLKHSIVIVASSDEGPSMRIRCAHYACALAEYFRDRGNDVVLYMDSLTRVARAQRELGLLRGEIPASRGYPPSPRWGSLFYIRTLWNCKKRNNYRTFYSACRWR